MKKFTKILAGISALVLSLSVVGCSNKTLYPDFRKLESYNPGEEVSEKYTINVRSEGGYKLDGVRVTAYNPKGEAVKTGISSDGVINLGLTLDEYTLKVDEDSLPAGYFLEDGATFKTNPKQRDPVDISIPSTVISQSAPADKVYAVGDIVNDFSIKDYTGKEYRLSTLLKSKKAVVLNFWFPTCVPCRQEFPAVQSAYSDAKNDLEILGLAFPNRVKDNDDIAEFKEEYKKEFNITFPLCIGTSAILNNYSASAAPTTAVIDRYGMLAYWHANSEPSITFWQSLFKKYTADDYVQEINEDPENPGGNPSQPSEKPDVTMPTNAEMAAAGNGAGLTATYRADIEDEFAWPWTVGTDEAYGQVLTVTNTGKQNSYATLYVDVTLKKDDLLSFDYTVSSEKDNDKLYVLLDGQLINAEGWSGQIGWTSEDVYVADRDKTVELSFIYLKDDGDPSADKIGADTAKIKNIRTSKISADTEALDVIREAATGEIKEGKYSNYTAVVLGSDGYYHVGTENGPLLYMSISNITPWSALHAVNSRIDTAEGTVYASLYDMTFYKYANTIEDDNNNLIAFTVLIGQRDFSEPLIEYHHILDVLEKPYQLMPVTPQLKEWAQAYTAEYAKEKGASTHDNEWLEFCFYYDHYGKDHGEDDYCRRNTNILEGLTIYDCYEVGFDSTPADGGNVGKQSVSIKHALARPNGVYYKFTAPKDGVYQIRDYRTGSANPSLAIYEFKEDGLNPEYLQYCDGVMDFDAQINPAGYGAFNSYTVLSAGQTVYLHFRIDEQTTGDFSFDIFYHSSVDKLINCSTADGAWTYDENGVFVYLGINAVYDQATDRYYLADAKGEPDRDRPIYINMLYSNFYMSDLGINSKPVSEMIDSNVFKNHVSAGAQNDMAVYLDKAMKNTGDYYGLVEADAKIVEILNTLIKNTGGAGDNRGWLAFACYTEHYSHPNTVA